MITGISPFIWYQIATVNFLDIAAAVRFANRTYPPEIPPDVITAGFEYYWRPRR